MTMIEIPLLETAIDIVRANGCVVLRPLENRVTYDECRSGQFAVLIDCETTDLDPATAEPIQVAMRRVWFGAHGISWAEEIWQRFDEPKVPISAEASRVHGLYDHHVAQHRIASLEVADFVQGAEWIIAHNAAFDCPILCRRFPVLESIPWACSYTDVDWKGLGFDSAKLRFLLQDHCGLHAQHRHEAATDVMALTEILGTPLASNGVQPFAVMLDNAQVDKVKVEAWGADYYTKDALKAKGYRWNPDDKVWWTVVDAFDAEARAWVKTVAPRAVFTDIAPRRRFL